MHHHKHNQKSELTFNLKTHKSTFFQTIFTIFFIFFIPPSFYDNSNFTFFLEGL
jgi:hypothetical protein